MIVISFNGLVKLSDESTRYQVVCGLSMSNLRFSVSLLHNYVCHGSLTKVTITVGMDSVDMVVLHKVPQIYTPPNQ